MSEMIRESGLALGFLLSASLLAADIKRPPNAEVDAGSVGAHDEEACGMAWLILSLRRPKCDTPDPALLGCPASGTESYSPAEAWGGWESSDRFQKCLQK